METPPFSRLGQIISALLCLSFQQARVLAHGLLLLPLHFFLPASCFLLLLLFPADLGFDTLLFTFNLLSLATPLKFHKVVADGLCHLGSHLVQGSLGIFLPAPLIS